jgi:LuxR family transcriptional regulator, maltose regulon positive regulatory protein
VLSRGQREPASAQRANRAGVRLLEDKLQAPRPGVTVLQRARVTELIDAAACCRVTLMTGPAGAGKTVAAAIWAAARPAGKPAAWVSLDEGDADPARFWTHVIAALARAGALTEANSVPPAELATSELPAWLSWVVKPRGEPAVLVIDGVHLLSGSPALAGLDDLVKHAPAGLRLLLVGRFAPGLALARLRVSGELADIGATDLACTADETASYFAMLGAPLSEEACTAVMHRTGGWMAGLRLAALGEQADEAAAHAMVTDYLEDEVLGPLPAADRNFMLRTCITETVPADLACELATDVGAAALLDRLSRENGLVTIEHADPPEYRYHPMLRDVLLAALRRERPEEIPELQGMIARWHACRGDVLPAMRAAAAIGDWAFAVQLLREAGPAVMLSADGPGLAELLGGCSPALLAGQPVLALSLAAALLWQGDADGALPHLECAEDWARGLPAPDRQTATLWVAALRILHAAGTGAVLGSLHEQWLLASRAHDDPGGVAGHQALGVLWLALGFAALRDFDGQEARSALLHAGSQLSAGGMLALRERARSWEAVASALYGDMAAATRLGASVADGPHGNDQELIPVLALASALVSLARDEPAAAAALLDQVDLASMTPRPAGEPGLAMLSGLLKTRLAVADGNLAGARGLVRWLTNAAAAAGAAAGTVTAITDAEISLAAGDKERARATLAGLPPSGALDRPEATICQARLLIADADDKNALQLIDPLLADAAGACSINDRVAALLTAVIAHRRLGQPGEATELLTEALALAEPDDACGPFLAAGPAMRSALTVLITPASKCAAFAARILDRFDGRLPRSGASQHAASLTDSELAVLRFLPSHMTNQEIAESLFLSINTIKTHLSSVYRKLGVINRRQAIAQGRRLELLLAGGWNFVSRQELLFRPVLGSAPDLPDAS